MYTGPKLQSDISVILMRFRQFKYICMADVQKMFWMIKVRPEDAKYQVILWKFEGEELQPYQITSVVFG